MPLSTKFLFRFAAKLSRCLSLALLPALASEARALSAPQRKPAVRSAAQPVGVSNSKPRPYLAALGPLPLRFARPGLEPTAEPPASPEPKPATPPEQTAPAANDSAHPPLTPSSDNAPKNDAPASDSPAALETSEPTTHPALPILPDDTKRELRPEDVLPFFRYPNASPTTGDASVQVLIPFTAAQPQSTPIPPSSATYQQK
jgi:hypothetical protein